MNAAPTHQPANRPADSGSAWRADLRRMGLDVDAEGIRFTMTPQVMPFLFGRPAYHSFTLAMSGTSLLRLRHLLAGGGEVLHVPVHGHVITCEQEARPTSRLIATAQYVPARRVVLEVTTWNSSLDGAEAWLDTYLLDDLTGPDLDHFAAVQAMWTAGVRPRHHAARYVAAGFSPREARRLQETVPPADRDAQIDLLIALRTGADGPAAVDVC